MEIDMRFDDKVAIVTGSSAGFGAAIAERFVAGGARVILNGRDADKLARAVGRYPEGSVHPVRGDASERSVVDALVAGAIDRFGRLDIVVSNAPVYFPSALKDQQVEDWRRTFAMFAEGAMHLSQAALPHLEKRGGSIVYVSAVGGTAADKGWLAYGAAKAAVNNMTLSLAVELGPKGIRVNAVLPSISWTESTQVFRDAPDLLARIVERIPLGRLGEAHELAAAAAFLASDDASYITGALLRVDGGVTATTGQAAVV